MFPLKQRKLIRGAVAHVAAGLGVAADYVANTGTEYFAPFDGKLSIPYPAFRKGKETSGGMWLRLTRDNGDAIEVAHLSDYKKNSGSVKMGELVALTGNSGSVTSHPHAHIQILDKNSKRLDPEKYNWGNPEGEPVTQEQKDFEKAYVFWQYLYNQRPPSHAEVQAKVDHHKAIMQAQGIDETAAWHQIYKESGL